MFDPARLHAIVLAGGSGTRLWPLSTKARPKQFLNVAGNGRTMLQETMELLKGLVPLERVVVVTGKPYASLVREQIPGLPPANLLVEPLALNTAPAMAVAAALIRSRDPEAVVVSLPSDHYVGDGAAVQRMIGMAAESADAQSAIVVAGATPKAPSTGFGYVEVGEVVGGSAEIPVHRAISFIEKPPASLAESFFNSGRYLWNANYYTFHVRTFESSLSDYVPNLSGLIWPKQDVASFLEKVYESATAVSIDHAMAHRLTNLHVVPVPFEWSDLGDWDQLYRLLAAHSAGTGGNVVAAPDGRLIVAVDSARNLVIQTSARPVGLVGVTDSIVVDTPDALLVAHRDNVQQVRAVTARLAEIVSDPS